MYFTKLTSTLYTIVLLLIIPLGYEAYHDVKTSHDDSNPVPLKMDEITISGQLSGFDCAVVGVLCPTTHRGADYTTGVFTEDETFYFIVNIPQSFLQQYFRETIEVEGTVYHPYEQAVEPEVIHLIEEEGGRRLVYEAGYFIDEKNRRATFQDGMYRNGRWIAEPEN